MSNYVTNFLSEGTDIGTTFAPAFTTLWLNGTITNITQNTNSRCNSSNNSNGAYVTNDGYYLLTFMVSFENNNTSTTSGSYGIYGAAPQASQNCQFPAFFGASGNANGPYYMTSYVKLVANYTYQFYFTWFGSDVPYTINFIIWINTYPPLLT